MRPPFFIDGLSFGRESLEGKLIFKTKDGIDEITYLCIAYRSYYDGL
jgi:hypothetical protein